MQEIKKHKLEIPLSNESTSLLYQLFCWKIGIQAKYTNVNLYLSGDYSQNLNAFIDFPVHFYKDLNLDFKETFTNYDVITTDNAITLFNYAKNINKPYMNVYY